MKALITTGLLAAALIGAAAGCADEAGVQDESDRYTLPEPSSYAAPARSGQATGVTGSPTGAGGEDVSGQARPGTWDASRGAEVEQPAPAPSPYQNLPPGSVAQPAGGTAQQQPPAPVPQQQQQRQQPTRATPAQPSGGTTSQTPAGTSSTGR